MDWNDTKIIEAELGDYLTVARKAKGTENWFNCAIADQQSKASTIELSFLEKGKK